MTQARLKELFEYNELTGLFTRLVSTTSRTLKGTIAGTSNSYGYTMIGIDGKIYAAHRLAWLYMYGKFPDHNIDHKDKDKSNNCISNLRDVKQRTNLRNCSKRSSNTSGHTGVSLVKATGRWKAMITIDYKPKYLGTFDTQTEAINARQVANKKYGFSPRHGM